MRDNRNLPRDARREALRDTNEERRMTLSEEELSVGKREVRAGEVEIDKDVETRHVRERVPVSHDEVVVERRPIEPGMRADARIGEEEIHVPLSEEEVIAQKRVVPKEEIVARKHEVVENDVVEADLRRERASMHREGDERIRNYDADRDGMR